MNNINQIFRFQDESEGKQAIANLSEIILDFLSNAPYSNSLSSVADFARRAGFQIGNIETFASLLEKAGFTIICNGRTRHVEV